MAAPTLGQNLRHYFFPFQFVVFLVGCLINVVNVNNLHSCYVAWRVGVSGAHEQREGMLQVTRSVCLDPSTIMERSFLRPLQVRLEDCYLTRPWFLALVSNLQATCNGDFVFLGFAWGTS